MRSLLRMHSVTSPASICFQAISKSQPHFAPRAAYLQECLRSASFHAYVADLCARIAYDMIYKHAVLHSCLHSVSTTVPLHVLGVHLRAARTCRTRFSCREYDLWHCVHTCIFRRQRSCAGHKLMRVGVSEVEEGGVKERRWRARRQREGWRYWRQERSCGVAFGGLPDVWVE